ncbi:MAG: DinB family protein [Dehalococcoidia bacterium]|nr:DinB family protein [Dehalococcoidia bacterium]
MPADTLLQRLFLDAQEEFLKAIDHVPNPGRGGPIGGLNPAGWTVMHLAAWQHAWIGGTALGAPPDEGTRAWVEGSQAQPVVEHTPPYDVAHGHFERIAEQTSRWVESWSWEGLLEPASVEAPNRPWAGATRAYLVARSIAHAFVHAGDLTVVAALMARGDLGLPGDLRHSAPPTAQDDPSVPVVAALARDGFEEVRRVAVFSPTPAVVGAMDRLNPVSHTIAHVLGREDRLWNVAAQGREEDPTLAALRELGSAEPTPLPWGDCLDALDRVEANVGRWLATLTPEVGATPMKWREDSSYAAQIARSAAHLFSHAGEMMAHASLYGVADIGMPGRLQRVREATTPSSPGEPPRG